MSDNLENDKQEIEGQSTENEVKSLTQDAVNNIVQQRLKRQKKEFEEVVSQLSQENETQASTLKAYEEFINSHIAQVLGDLPEPIQDLVGKLSVPEKLEWLKKYSKSEELRGFEKQTIPTTPKGKEGEKTFKPNTRNVFKI